MNICTLPKIPEIKNGDTLTMNCVYKIAGVASSLTGFTVLSQIRDLNNKLAKTLTVTLGDQVAAPGSFTLSAGNVDLKPANYFCDIQFTDPTTFVRSTQTFIVPVVQDITYV
jgi:hypothetical protein